jgi:methylmalonyl-CoA/ethylmalonyl-CoA epimerase
MTDVMRVPSGVALLACNDRSSATDPTQGALEVKITAIDHVGIAVADLDTAIAFYERSYGMRCVHVEVNEEQGVREAMMAVGDSGSYIQLLSPLSPDTTIGKFLDKSGPGIQQMAYRVEDIDEACDHLRGEGLRLLYDEPKNGTAGSRVNFIHPKSSGGILVELVEPGPGGMGDH